MELEKREANELAAFEMMAKDLTNQTLPLHGGLRSVRSITFSFDRFDRFGRFGFFPFVFRFFVKISNFNWPGLGPGRLGRTGRLGRAPALAN